MKEIGIVIEVFNDIAKVKVQKGSACAGCATKLICKPFGTDSDEKIVEATNNLNAGVGDQVVLNIGTEALLKSSLILFILPIFFLVFGGRLGLYIAHVYPQLNISEETLSVLCGAGGFGVAFVIISYLNKKYSATGELRPKIVSIGTKPLT